jgi:hypothetical protein
LVAKKVKETAIASLPFRMLITFARTSAETLEPKPEPETTGSHYEAQPDTSEID